jgi:hypothetical protein
MFERRFYLILLLLIGSLLLITPSLIQAQQIGDETCTALVKQALDAVGNSCTEMDRNNACYGYNLVSAQFAEETASENFSVPSDRTGLTNLTNIQTAALDAELETWGIAVMNVQANVPGSLPGQAVVFLLLGDVGVENQVDPADAILPTEPTNVTAVVNANARSIPSTTGQIVGSISNGDQLQADGLNFDKTWVRVLLNDLPAWIRGDLLQPENADALNALPIVDGKNYTPMQAFKVRTSFGSPQCDEAPPSVLVVQGPEDITVSINANGADIRISSTIALYTTAEGKMVLLVISGSANVGGYEIPAGFMMEASLNEDGEVDGPWEFFRPLSEEEIAQLRPLEDIPEELLHYKIVIPTPDEIAETLRVLRERQQGGNDNTTDSGTDTTDGGTTGGTGGIVPNPGTYTLVSGSCELSGGATLSNVAADGSSFNWGVLHMVRNADSLYVSGGLYILPLSADSVQLGGFQPGDCVTQWSRTG